MYVPPCFECVKRWHDTCKKNVGFEVWKKNGCLSLGTGDKKKLPTFLLLVIKGNWEGWEWGTKSHPLLYHSILKVGNDEDKWEFSFKGPIENKSAWIEWYPGRYTLFFGVKQCFNPSKHVLFLMFTGPI